MERVLILGATSAIAAEVALLHAARGDRLHLIGRSAEKLASVVARVGRVQSSSSAAGKAQITFAVADFTRTEDNEATVRAAIAALGGLDRVLIAHGLLGDQLASEREFPYAKAILETNFLSVVSLLIPLVNQLEAARAGRLAVITSVAGDRGRPRNYTYGAAKGALNLYLQGVRSRLVPANVKVITIKLGPVDTPMTTAHAKNALFGKPEKVARQIVRAVDRGAGEVYVPPFWAAIMLLVRNAPEWLFQRAAFLSGR